MSLDKVSIIIPNYNHAPYLRKRIDSVLDQTYPNVEVIILDDFSSDNSKQIIESYRSDPRVSRIILNEFNSGSAFIQWRRGIELATGKYVWIAESDDYAERNFLEIMTAAFAGDDSIGLVYCDSYILDKEGLVQSETFKTIRNNRHNTIRWSYCYKNSGISELSNWFLPDGTINNTSAVLFNREILTRANPFDLDLKYLGDKYAFMKVMAISDIKYVCNSLNYYRDPFNIKYLTKTDYIFEEQFLVFNWLLRAQILSNKKFRHFLLMSTRVSVYRNWTRSKHRIFSNLFRVNWSLFSIVVVYNIAYPIITRLKNAIGTSR